MNNRIHELYTQAILEVQASHGYSDAYHNIVAEKFAELIVRECCDQFVELRTRPADLAAKDVKKYFGVE